MFSFFRKRETIVCTYRVTILTLVQIRRFSRSRTRIERICSFISCDSVRVWSVGAKVWAWSPVLEPKPLLSRWLHPAWLVVFRSVFRQHARLNFIASFSARASLWEILERHIRADCVVTDKSTVLTRVECPRCANT